MVYINILYPPLTPVTTPSLKLQTRGQGSDVNKSQSELSAKDDVSILLFHHSAFLVYTCVVYIGECMRVSFILVSHLVLTTAA